MKIETEFDVGDTVYIIDGNRITECEISATHISGSFDENGPEQDISYSIIVGEARPLECRGEDMVGRTPEALAKKLLKDFE